MPIQQLSHLTFIVKDLDRMAQFLCDGLGAIEIYDSQAQHFSLSHEKFFSLGELWIAAMQGDPPTERSYQHVAFKRAVRLSNKAGSPRRRHQTTPPQSRGRRAIALLLRL
jgi:catechol 2,3-dioxygenase-like lactoylglutathione lyase family enzyme